MQILRKSVTAKSVTEFKFDLNCTKFLVKNLTGGKMYASLGNEYLENFSSLILKDMSEYLEVNEDFENPTTSVTVYSEFDGEIEVQALQYTALSINILDNLKKIANAVFGKDVRMAIHDSIQIINNKANNLEKLLKNLIKNSTLSSPSNVEIVQARGDFDLLNDRLNSIDTSIQNIEDLQIQNKFNSINNLIEENKIIENQKSEFYTVIESQNTFALPDNYNKNSIVEVYSDEEKITSFSINEVTYVNCVILEEAVSNCNIEVKCKNFSSDIIDLIKKITADNMSVG